MPRGTRELRRCRARVARRNAQADARDAAARLVCSLEEGPPPLGNVCRHDIAAACCAAISPVNTELQGVVVLHVATVDLSVEPATRATAYCNVGEAARLLGVKSLVIFTTDSDKVVDAYYTGLQHALWWHMYSWCDRIVSALATRVYTRSEEFLQKLERVHGIKCMGVMSQSDQYSAFWGVGLAHV